MELSRLTDRIYFLPHEAKRDRPSLAYVVGDESSLAVDAGASAAHVEDFYGAIAKCGFREPDLTVITHWHWDHTFGMHRVSGITVAHEKTNVFLNEEADRLEDSSYVESLKEEDFCLATEYKNGEKLIVVQSTVEFSDKFEVDLGNLKVEVFHSESPHSKDTVLIYVPKERVLFLGDSTSEDFFNDGYMDWELFDKIVKTIEGIDCHYCVLSHAEPLLKEELLEYLYSIRP